jgi:hypothetical protein
MVVLTLGSTSSNEAKKNNTRPTSKVPISGSDNIHFLQDCGLEAEWVPMSNYEDSGVAKLLQTNEHKPSNPAAMLANPHIPTLP